MALRTILASGRGNKKMGKEKRSEDFHYDAFISYRHAPLDIAVAEEIQKQLEHFHVPSSIRKRTGKQRIRRIFRDKAELPITSDLNDDIFAALEDADFLIVICSPSTHESQWVQREIETFLRFHDRKHILTVIAGGEPADVIPKIVCEETVETVTDDGQHVMVRIPLEPLSCDYRLDRRRARREELPRLAAAILGCRYDELRQRQREYRNRIAGAAMAAVGCLLAYFIWSNLQIRKNYTASLQNQSRYLAQQSLIQTNNADQLTAVQLALEALPGNGRNRPVVPEAVYALQTALGLYDNAALTNFGMTGRYGMESRIRAFWCSRDGSRVVTEDMDCYNLWFWEAKEGEAVAKYTSEAYINSIAVSGNDRILVQTYDRLVCLSMQSGEVLWQQTENGIRGAASAVLDDRETLVLLFDGEITLADPENGNVLRRISFSVPEHMILDELLYSDKTFMFSEDGTRAVLPCAWTMTEEGGHRSGAFSGCILADLVSGAAEFVPCTSEIYEASGLLVRTDGTILVCGQDYKSSIDTFGNGSYMQEGNSAPLAVYDNGRFIVNAFSAGEEEAQWSQDILFSGNTQQANECIWLVKNTGSSGRDILLAAVADKASLLDPKTGDILYTYELEDAFIEPCNFTNRYVCGFLANGNLSMLGVDEEIHSSVDVAGSGLAAVEEFRNQDDRISFYLLIDGILYRLEGAMGGEDWTSCEAGAANSVDSRKLLEDVLLCWNYNGPVQLMDLDSGRLRWNMDLAEDGGNSTEAADQDIRHNYEYIGSSRDQKLLYFADHGWEIKDYVSDNGRLLSPLVSRVDAKTGEIRIEELPVPLPSTLISAWIKAGICMENGRIWYIVRSYRQDSGGTEYSLFGTDPEDGSFSRFRFPVEAGEPASDMGISPDGRRALVFRTGNAGLAGWICDMETETCSELQIPDEERTEKAGDVYADRLCSWSEDSTTVAVYWEEKRLVRVFDASGHILQDITGFPGSVKSLAIHEGELLLMTVSDAAQLNRYRIKDGAFTGRTKFEGNSAFIKTEWSFREDALFLRNSSRLYIMDTEDYVLTGTVRSCIGYEPKRNRIYTTGQVETAGGEETRIGWFPYYSVEEMVQKGEAFAGNASLTKEQRSAFGIE